MKTRGCRATGVARRLWPCIHAQPVRAPLSWRDAQLAAAGPWYRDCRPRRSVFMSYRRTLKRSVGCTGIGLHSGRPVRLDLKPAPAGHGIRFLRTDVGVEIPASVPHLGALDHATTLTRDGVSVETVEHLLSAFHALGVDDVLVEVDSPEMPVMDGSAAPFVILLHEAGLRPQKATREYLKILRPVEVVRGPKWARLSPSDHLRVTYTIGFEHPLLRHQTASFRIAPDSYAESIAPARTFGFLREVEMLRKAG